MANLALLGGPKACEVPWPSWPMWDDTERQGLLDVLESGKWWYGERVREFETRFAAFHGAGFGVTATSGTTALETALMAVGVGAGDEVIVPPYTFMATASAVIRVGATPVFADIQPRTLCLDPDDAARKFTPKTKAIVPVHLAGYVADMDKLREVAAARGIAIVEDACHAWGSQWRDKGVGALGACGVFSFQASKNITSAEGGIILTDDAALAERCRSMTNCGRVPGKPWYHHEIAGSNLRLTEFQAAILLAQLARLEGHIARREANAALLNRALRGIPGVMVLDDEPRMTRRSYHFYPFRLDLKQLGVGRDRFVEALAAEGVQAAVGYTMPLYQMPAFASHLNAPASCPVCEQVCTDTVWIRHTTLLADAHALELVAAAVEKVVRHAAELR